MSKQRDVDAAKGEAAYIIRKFIDKLQYEHGIPLVRLEIKEYCKTLALLCTEEKIKELESLAHVYKEPNLEDRIIQLGLVVISIRNYKF